MGQHFGGKRPRGRRYYTKVYLVMQRRNLAKGDEPNVVVLHVFLTSERAGKKVEEIPGTWVERHFAIK